VNRVGAGPVCPEYRCSAPDPGRSPDDREAVIDATWWRWARPLVGALVLAALVVVLGTGPFLDAVRATDVRALAAGAVIALLTTLCGAWRWRLVAHRLGADLTLTSALASCYRAQFLNATLPGGVLGDVGRGVQHGRTGGDVGRGLRGVAWERTTGQVVLAVLAAVALVVARPFDLPRLGGTSAAVVVAVLVAAGAAVAVAGRMRGHRATRWWDTVAADLRALGHGPAPVGIVVASVAAVAGHVAVFVLAARTVGVRTPVLELLPLALVVLVVSAVPLNLAGWGPREGAAAWVFAAAGLGAATGLATAVAFGAIAFVGTLPGAALLLAGRLRRQRPVEPAPALVGPPRLDAVGGGRRE
jgi:glycosyltransferase 2 family protein